MGLSLKFRLIDEAFAREQDGAVTGGSDAIAEPAPAPDEMGDYDWVELQVWTSLGTIRVTAN